MCDTPWGLHATSSRPTLSSATPAGTCWAQGGGKILAGAKGEAGTGGGLSEEVTREQSCNNLGRKEQPVQRPCGTSVFAQLEPPEQAERGEALALC